MKEKSAEGSSDGDRTFDFKYKIDLSDRRGKTGETFKQQSGFDFEDFKDFRDDNKTQKSQIYSQKKWLPSDLVKKSDESMIIPENPTENSIRKQGGSFIAQNRIRQSDDGNFISQGASPKFSDQKFYQTISHNQFEKSLKEELSVSQKAKLASKYSMNLSNQIDEVDEKSPNKFTSPRFNDKLGTGSYNISSSRNNKQPPSSSRFSPEAEYQDILNSITYYEHENEKLDYQTIKLLQQIQIYQKMVSDNPSFDYQLQKLTEQTNILNSQISNQRSLERTLIQHKKIVEDEFDQISQSIEGLHFQRPSIIRDETKAIIDQINSLKSEFESLKRDEGSLNFSTSVMNQNNQQISSEYRGTNLLIPNNNPLFNPEQTLMNQSKQQILQHSKDKLNYIYNIKMMIVKDQWKMYEDSDICISCSTRDYPVIELRIGNKTVRNFGGFSLKEAAAVVVDKQILQAKSYYVHSIRMSKISQPFLKLQLTYTTTSTFPKHLPLFLPTLPLKHGQFIPITQKQYKKESCQHRQVLDEYESLQKPIDTKIINESLQQLQLYFPNLLYQVNEKGDQICKGIFRLWNSNEGALVKIRKRGHVVDIRVRNNLMFLLEALEFFITVIV